MTLQNHQYSSSRFSPTKPHNPCPICDDIKGKCRIISEDLVLCMTHPQNIGVSGWHYLGETQGSYYAGKYGRSHQESESERRQRQETNRNLRAAQQKAKHEQLAKLPDAAQRDRLYQNYLQKFTLNELDRSDLQRRGLNEQEIARLGAKSVKAGYVLPMRNPKGQIVGAQIRLRDGSSGRYRWHKPFGIAAQQQNGELPLAFHGDRQNPPSRIILAEGTGIKPYFAARLRQCPAIGASGGQFVASPNTLLDYFQSLGASPEQTKLEYAIDAGDVANPSVMRRHQKNLDSLTDLGYQIDVLWWGQFTKSDRDIDELTDATNIEILTIEQFFQIANYQAIPKFAPWQWLQNKLFPKPKAKGFTKRSPQFINNLQEYPAGARRETWHNALQSHKHVLDASATGTGKSYDVGLLRPEMFNGIAKIIYISKDSRNVTTETLQDWQVLPARHNGLTTKNGKLRRIKQGEALHTSANCSRSGAIAALRNKAITDTSIVCETCPLLKACRHASGDGYGFRHERAKAFKSAILRSHPQSLPSPEEYDYAHTLLVWEEVGESLVTMRQIQVDRADVDAAIAKISRAQITGLEQLLPMLTHLYELLGDQTRFGLNYQAIKKAMTKAIAIPTIDHTLISDLLQPDLSILDKVDGIADFEFEQAKGKDKRELTRINQLLKRETTLHAAEIEKKIDREVLKQWLTEFIDILTGKIQHGDLSIHHGQLTISLRDPQLLKIAHSASGNLYLDATVYPADLALKLDRPIHVVKQAHTLSMPTIYQVTNLGRMGMQRGNEQIRKAAAIALHLQQVDPTTKIIDFKKFADHDDGVWFRDSRGSNDFKDVHTLIINGTPCPNLAALRAEFATLTGLHPETDDPNFVAFVDRQILANIQQCFGRKSGNRFQEGDVIYFLSDFDLGDLPHNPIKASDITAAAMDKQEVLILEISQRVEQALVNGVDLLTMSQRQLATWLDLSWGKFRHHMQWIEPLLKDLYSNLIQNLDENISPISSNLETSDQELIEFWVRVTERFLIDVRTDSDVTKSTLAGLMEFFGEHIPQYLHQLVIAKFSRRSRQQLLASFAIAAGIFSTTS
ncbi:hypothetical protein [Pseudanabaena sp. ABRG5-3]|uniref:hypothetical protein n=1 Tax=Pseudanabaena sp. ABRG5-3 TaxID=685565 RepID=UPI000F8333FB|nr:hypothetical protein [Pseudanabaena sp. ABRG5-3]